ncbi:acyl-CoA dehydrogenase family protein [Geodermatophilus sp. URMC 62]|uniref:acyl-CoA dehydrogenase family protein n=1 Tax=Geodermatophilus sp. URMC 62 TaxID=3423414 RepID=UPI00406CA494
MTMAPTAPAATLDFTGLTDEEAVERARGLRELLRSQQQEAETLGHYTEEVHQALLASGLHHVLTPKRYGGAELSVKTFVRVAIEIATGDPGSGWSCCLGEAHCLTAAAQLSEQAQDEVFRNDAGYSRSPLSYNTQATATPVDGGFLVKGKVPYSSGVAFSTHAQMRVEVEGEAHTDGVPVSVIATLPRADHTVADDWGADYVLGMRASGSQSVLIDEVFVPAEMVVPMEWIGDADPARSGAAVHDNSMYLGIGQSMLKLEPAAVAVGNARAALDEVERLAQGRRSLMPPYLPRAEDPFYQREFGEARFKTDAAEAVVLQISEYLAEWSEAALRHGKPFTNAMDATLYGMAIQAGRLSSDAVEQLFRAAGTSAARPGQRMERYLRDTMTYQTHGANQYGQWAQMIGATRFGIAGGVDLNGSLPSERSRSATKA